MWNLSNIPKVAHFYWGRNNPLSFMRYMALRSFRAFNPDWSITLHTPTKPSAATPWPTHENKRKYTKMPDHWDAALEIHDLSVETVEFKEELPEVHRKDILFWEILSIEGGVVADIDILFRKPMASLSVNENNTGAEMFLVKGKHHERAPEYHPIGFLMSAPGNEFFKAVADAAWEIETSGYQDFGKPLLEKILAEREPVQKTAYIPFEEIYPYHFADVYTEESGPDCFAVHWYAGLSSVLYDAEITPENIHLLKNVWLFREMRRIYEV